MSDEKDDEFPDVEFEDDEPCIEKDNRDPNCQTCHHSSTCNINTEVNPNKVTSEPVNLGVPFLVSVDVHTLTPAARLAAHVSLKTDMTATEYRSMIDGYKAAMIKHLELNPTKGLETCAGAVIYFQLMALPAGLTAPEIIFIVSELLTAYHELSHAQLYARQATPPGTKVN